MKKKCKKCEVEKEDSEYYRGNICRNCTSEVQKLWYKNNSSLVKERSSKRYLAKRASLDRDLELEARLSMLGGAKTRASKKGLDFDLTLNDIIIPAICPVLGIKIDVENRTGRKAFSHNSPSIDRFNNDLGYTKENIRIISARANNLKNNGTLEEFKKIVEYMEQEKDEVYNEP